MMIALLLATAAPVSEPGVVGLGPIGRQQLPAHGCAAFLWSQPGGDLVAMATAGAGQLKLVLDGKPLDLPRTGESGQGDLGFAAQSVYAAGAVSVTLAMTVERRQGLTDGAAVTAATLTVARTGGDTLIVPAVGLVGCAAT